MTVDCYFANPQKPPLGVRPAPVKRTAGAKRCVVLKIKLHYLESRDIIPTTPYLEYRPNYN